MLIIFPFLNSQSKLRVAHPTLDVLVILQRCFREYCSAPFWPPKDPKGSLVLPLSMLKFLSKFCLFILHKLIWFTITTSLLLPHHRSVTAIATLTIFLHYVWFLILIKVRSLHYQFITISIKVRAFDSSSHIHPTQNYSPIIYPIFVWQIITS